MASVKEVVEEHIHALMRTTISIRSKKYNKYSNVRLGRYVEQSFVRQDGSAQEALQSARLAVISLPEKDS